MRRVLHIVSVTLITAGIVIATDVAMTLLWKEPLSTVYGSIKQGQAADSLAALEKEFPSSADLRAVHGSANVEERVAGLADLFAGQVQTGQGIGRIEIPSIDLSIVVVQGTDTASLQKGPGHYPDTAFPGQGKTIGIAGHRTTYLAPFRRINEIADGDTITLEMPYGTFTYEVQEHRIVDPSDVEIVDDVGYERLVLTACHPLYSAAQRWAVFAKLVDTSLFAADDRLWQDP
ncbi:MAG: sortase [Solirubrobacterales bacterium]|jgi:sortase A|nr:sortase [Solirubrobacterales bacterium]